ncbi:LppU/SCO3897 family protein [Gordonia paraffinivorans]|uniref:LppU/SCO3897 family protein n=1 Tax=Gordonia paraffinivorans TaxID=175628 RepID=UPI0014485F02|nr:hypothetical protein [Gordonia paraffinivorans]
MTTPPQGPGRPGQGYPGNPYPGGPYPGRPGAPGPYPGYAGAPGPGSPYVVPSGYPGPGHPPHAPVPPPKKKNTVLWWVLGGAALLVVAVVVTGVVLFVVAAGKSDRVWGVDDVAVGECVTVSGEDEPVVRKVSCDSTDFHFAVALKADPGVCAAKNYSRLWFGEGDSSDSFGKWARDGLCLAHVYQQGRCYHLPSSKETNALADVREIDCSSPPATGAGENFEVESKVSGMPECSEEQSEYFTEKPTPTGYCLRLLE